MKKSNYILASVLAAALMLTGCGGENDKKPQNTGNENSADAVLDFNAEEYVKLGDYKGLEVTYPSVQQVTDEDVEQYIQGQLADNTEFKEVDRASKEGDTVNIDYTGTIGGEEFEGGSDTEYDLELGSQDFLPEFEESLVGKKAGETAVFTLTFPSEDYDESVAGQEAEFTVKVNSVSEAVTPEYNVDFVKSISEYETLEDYEASIKEELIASYEEESETEKGEHALRLVAEQAEVNGYPQELYDFFYEDNVAGYKAFAEMQGMEYEEFLETFMSEEDIIEVVKEQVNEHLISQAILQKEGIEITDEEYAEAGKELALTEGYGSLEEYEGDYGKTYITTQLVREKAIDILKESANLQEVPWDEYDDYGEELESE